MSNESKSGQAPVSATALFSRSSKLVRENLKLFAILFFIPFVLSFVNTKAKMDDADKTTSLTVNFIGMSVNNPGRFLGIGLFFGTLIFLAMIISSLMVYFLALKVANGQKPTFTEVWDAFMVKGAKVFLLNIVVALVFAFGLLLLIIPGLIFLRRYYLAPYVFIDQDVGIFEAMRRSAAMSKPYSMAVWGVIAISFGLAIVSVVPVLGPPTSVVLGAMYSVAAALRYNELKALTAEKSS